MSPPFNSDQIIIARNVLEGLWKNHIDHHSEQQPDADGVTIRISHVDYEDYRHEMRRLQRWLNASSTLICDHCGKLFPEDDDSDVECCDCGRMCLRMDRAKITADG